MASTYGEHLKVTIAGESHGPSVRVDIEGVPEGTVIDYRELDDFLRRRSALNEDTKELTTQRKEPDEVIWKEGVVNFGGEFGTVHLRHPHVGENQVDRLFAEKFQGGLSRAGRGDVVESELVEERLRDMEVHRHVIDDEDADGLHVARDGLGLGLLLDRRSGGN